MAKQTVEIPCEMQYAKVFYETRDKEGYKGKYKAHDGAYTIDAVMNADTYKQLKDTGCQKEGKIWDEEDEKWVKGSVKELRTADRIMVKFERKHEAPYTYGGPPQVAHADGTPWSLDEDGLIGNGSTGYVYVTVSDFEDKEGETGYRTNLDGVQVIDHVVYETDFDPEQSSLKIPDRSGGTTKKSSPKKETTKKSAAKKEPEDDFEDEIPF